MSALLECVDAQGQKRGTESELLVPELDFLRHRDEDAIHLLEELGIVTPAIEHVTNHQIETPAKVRDGCKGREAPCRNAHAEGHFGARLLGQSLRLIRAD